MPNKKIRILFDASSIVNGSKSGVGYYTFYLIEALSYYYEDDIEITCHYFNFLGRKSKLSLPRASNINYLETKFLPGKIVNICRRFGFQPPIELFVRKKFDLHIFPNFVSLPSIRKTPSAIVIHDLCYLKAPQYVAKQNRYFLQNFVPRALNSCSLLIAVSNFTMNEVKSSYRLGNILTHVTFTPPPKPQLHTPSNLIKNLGIKSKYFLFIGNIEPRKNISNLVSAYVSLPESIKNSYGLVLAGGKGWLIDEAIEFIQSHIKNGEDIIMTGYVDEDVKAALYGHASALILPSYYEGFGMPILEAMSYGVPTVVSDLPVFHEVSGNASIYVNPGSVKSIATGMKKVVSDSEKREKMIEEGNNIVKNSSWKMVAEDLYSSIVRLLAKD